MLAFIGPLGGWELVVIAVLGLLIFGKRLPEVGKSIGQGIVEFKKGLSGIEEDVNSAGKSQSSSKKAVEDKTTASSAEVKDRDKTA